MVSAVSIALFLVSLFLACSVTAAPLADGTTEKLWLACTWASPSSAATASAATRANEMPMDEIVRSFDVHGVFRRTLFVLEPVTAIPLLEARGFKVQPFASSSSSSSNSHSIQPQQKYMVVEFNPKVTERAERDFLRISELRQGLVFAGFDSNLVVIDGSVLDLEAIPGLDWLEMAEVFPLRNTPIVPPPRFEDTRLYGYLSKLEPNPVISNVIQDISAESLEDEVFHLSESYYTRISSSKELKEAQSYLVNTFRSLGFNVTTQNYWETYADNICADLIGTENPESIVMAGAHYDSRSTSTSDPSLRAPGAVDNGSGTAGMVEMARVLSARSSTVKFSNTIRLCVWSGEEQGLLGSEAYARKMVNEKADIVAYFNADMTGYKLPSSPRIIMGMKDSSVTQWLLNLSFQITEMYVPELPVDLSSSCCSDYISFYNHGYPSIGYFQNPGSASDYPSYHKSSDTYEKNNYEQIRLETQAILAAIMVHAVPL